MKKIIRTLLAFFLVLGLVGCGSSGTKETPEYYGTYEMTGFVISGTETDASMTQQIIDTLKDQDSYFTLVVDDKSKLIKGEEEYPIKFNWEAKTFTDTDGKTDMSFEYNNGEIRVDAGSDVIFIMTKQ